MQIYNTMMYLSRKVEPKSAVNLLIKKLAPSALVGVGLSLDPEGKSRSAGAHRLLAFGMALAIFPNHQYSNDSNSKQLHQDAHRLSAFGRH